MLFLLKTFPKLPAITSGMPLANIAVTACSLELPQPNEKKTLRRGYRLIWRRAERGIIVPHTHLRHFLAGDIVLVSVFAGIYSVGIDVIRITEDDFARYFFGETGKYIRENLQSGS